MGLLRPETIVKQLLHISKTTFKKKKKTTFLNLMNGAEKINQSWGCFRTFTDITNSRDCTLGTFLFIVTSFMETLLIVIEFILTQFSLSCYSSPSHIHSHNIHGVLMFTIMESFTGSYSNEFTNIWKYNYMFKARDTLIFLDDAWKYPSHHFIEMPPPTPRY